MSTVGCEIDSKKNNRRSFSPSCILLLNGFPGVGKLTIAKALQIRLRHNNAPHRLIDNHLLIDPVVTIEPERNTAHYFLRKSFRRTAFERLKALKEEELVLIFTACLVTSRVPTAYDDIEQFGEYVDFAEAKGVPLVMFNIVCDLSANCGRLYSEERRKGAVGGKTKLVNIEVLEKIRQETSLLAREQVMACKKGVNIVYFEVDTSDLAAGDAAEKVWDLLDKI
ncbi:uncharacterized protein LY89DRAFT_270937 [Mollisia scopiformis]|uniref:Uncharacterized protein n=1 Tax=Mollisia scopiformis TaxID=149040 RepID=A0A132BEN9_MOLSC|nr:uncharacterized protein LY89DRAFT_270937 [Mollisia scopiformis]KUJ10147.1 hypothetical protein LY89DRAFT_270937 [Mollisia scopiformis]